LTLDLSGNSIRQLPRTLRRLKSLALARNQLDNLSDKLIASLLCCKSLETLDLGSNSLTIFPPAFVKLKNLKNLCLRENQISEFPLLMTIEILDLAQNRLREVPPVSPGITALCLDFNLIEVLERGFPKLTQLFLNMNRLHEISRQVCFPCLEVLELSKNKLTDIPDLTEFAPNLRQFNGAFNLLTNFPNFPATISKINLNDNQISAVPDVLTSLTGLVSFEIRNNRIQSLPALPPSIQCLVANGNGIEVLAPCVTPRLRLIALHENRLSDFPPFGQNLAAELFLKDNRLTSFSIRFLSRDLTRFGAISNGISEVPAELFTLPKLSHVNFAHNRIQRLPDTFSAARLTSINISENPIVELPDAFPETLVAFYGSYCGLTQLPDAFSRLPKLETIVACGNNIVAIPLLPRTLKKLILSRNKLGSVSAALPGSLAILDLSCNELTAIDVIELPELVELDISHNRLSALPLLRLPRVRALKLSCNAIEGDLDLEPFPYLDCLDFSFTSLRLVNVRSSIREILTSDAELFVSSQFKLVDTQRAGYAEMCGQRKTMEDAIVIHSNILPNCDLYCVFDGHGGCRTSTFCAYEIINLFASGEFSEDFVRIVVRRLLHNLRCAALADGSTMALALVSTDAMILAHLGDSRIVVFGLGGEVKYATIDHKPEDADEIGRILDAGGKVQNMRTDGQIAVAKSLGDFGVRGIGYEPSVVMRPIGDDERWLVIGCDGLFGMLPNENAGIITERAGNARNLAYDLRNVAYTRLCSDNISVIAVDLKATR
jgi:Leucine-rich repeat (LRR) protein/serine/threonine protein phosphatase PrpC